MAARQHLRQHEVMHVERTAQIDGDERLPFLGLCIREVLKAVPARIVHQHIHRALGERRLGARVVRDVEDQARAFTFGGDALGRFAHAVGNEESGSLGREPAADGGANCATAAGHKHCFAGESSHLGRLSITRFALPIERSTVPMRTSTVMPT